MLAFSLSSQTPLCVPGWCHLSLDRAPWGGGSPVTDTCRLRATAALWAARHPTVLKARLARPCVWAGLPVFRAQVTSFYSPIGIRTCCPLTW